MIQWFPGHMAKAKREIENLLKMANIIYLVLDARAPISSLNPDILKLAENKEILFLFNKSSLADLVKLNKIIKEEKIENYLIVDAIKKTNINKIIDKTFLMLEPYLFKQKEKGFNNPTVKALVLGIPNVGKSSLINALAKKKVASTNKLPGHTRQVKWINISPQIFLLDSPGVLWPKFADENTGYKLALTGAIKEEILPKDKLAKYGFNYLQENYPNLLKNYYQITENDENEFFNSLAVKRGFLLENKQLNLNQTYTQFLNDLKNGRIGVVCFD